MKKHYEAQSRLVPMLIKPRIPLLRAHERGVRTKDGTKLTEKTDTITDSTRTVEKRFHRCGIQFLKGLAWRKKGESRDWASGTSVDLWSITMFVSELMFRTEAFWTIPAHYFSLQVAFQREQFSSSMEQNELQRRETKGGANGHKRSLTAHQMEPW